MMVLSLCCTQSIYYDTLCYTAQHQIQCLCHWYGLVRVEVHYVILMLLWYTVLDFFWYTVTDFLFMSCNIDCIMIVTGRSLLAERSIPLWLPAAHCMFIFALFQFYIVFCEQ